MAAILPGELLPAWRCDLLSHFFINYQVLIHLNLRQSASPPPEELRHVQFSSEFPVNEEPPPPSYDQLAQDASGSTATERANTLGKDCPSTPHSILHCLLICCWCRSPLSEVSGRVLWIDWGISAWRRWGNWVAGIYRKKLWGELERKACQDFNM